MSIKRWVRYERVPQSSQNQMLSQITGRSQVGIFIRMAITGLGFDSNSDIGSCGKLQETQPKVILEKQKHNFQRILLQKSKQEPRIRKTKVSLLFFNRTYSCFNMA